MSTITKERLRERAREKVKSLEFAVTQTAFAASRAELEEELELARIALASLEAEPVADVVAWSSPNEERTCDVRLRRHDIKAGPLYTAPPAPANAEPVAWLWSHRKHPSEVTLIRPEDDEKAEAALWSGWSCQALYAEVPTSTPMKDHQIRELVNELRNIAVEYHGTQQLRERIARTIRAAMPQSFGNSEQLDSPVMLDGWVAVPVDMTPEQMRAVQLKSELGSYAAANLSGAYALFREFWDVSVAAAPQQEVKL